MKIEGMLFVAGTIFFVVIGTVYWFMSGEPTGTVALLLTAGLAAIVGFYVLFTGKRIGVRPEDRVDGDIEEGAGEYGFFSPHSWWPLPAAGFSAVIAAGLIYGWWLALIGVAGVLFSVVGMVFEYYRGAHAH